MSLPMPATAPVAEARCGECGEDVYFVEGLRGPQRWKHCRTGDWQCQPICATCGQPGIIRIGRHDMGGDGFPAFILDHWECGSCARQTCRIESA